MRSFHASQAPRISAAGPIRNSARAPRGDQRDRERRDEERRVGAREDRERAEHRECDQAPRTGRRREQLVRAERENRSDEKCVERRLEPAGRECAERVVESEHDHRGEAEAPLAFEPRRQAMHHRERARVRGEAERH